MQNLIEMAVRDAETIEGWMTHEELTWLATAALNKSLVIEFGSWHGRSSRALCTAKTLVCCDSWIGQEGVRLGDGLLESGLPYDRFIENLRPYLTFHAVRPYVLDLSSPEFVDRLILDYGGKADMVFIDADHSKEGVLRDIDTAKRLLKPSGLLCGHDYDVADWMGVTEAVHEAFGGNFYRAAGSIWVADTWL